MNETRYDWLADRWVIFAPNREERPDEFRQTSRIAPSQHVECPFCSGFEHETPHPSLVLPETQHELTTDNRSVDPSKSTLGWQVRVVPNKFPAIPRYDHFSGDSLSSHSLPSVSSFSDPTNLQFGTDTRPQQVLTCRADHLFQRHIPRGAHEVIIEAPTHIDSVTALPEHHIAMIFDAYRRRLNHWRAMRDLKYGVVFKNYGADAGASLYHSHSQLISLDFVPRDIEKMNDRLALHYAKQGRCYICQMIEEEEERQERIWYRTEHFVAICPFASRFPYSFSIVPRMHRSRYEEVSTDELLELAKIVKRTLTALEAAHPSAAYNFVLQTSPFRGGKDEAEHWRLRVIPRLSKVAGFEWGSDCFINTVTPEYATKVLRAHL